MVPLDRRWSIARGGLLAVYVAGYGVGRFWVEGLRIDRANEWGGLRLNQWVALAAILLAVAYLVWVARQGGIARRDGNSARPAGSARATSQM